MKPQTGKASALIKRDGTTPVLRVIGRETIAVKAGTRFRNIPFRQDTKVAPPPGGYVLGTDYVVKLAHGKLTVAALADGFPPPAAIGGFHFAPGSNAAGDSGGDTVPQINPCSLWDRNFRPACRNPRGMTLVEYVGGRFWCDIYLTGVDHETHGTSRLGATIADGNAVPKTPAGLARFDYA